mmetsp:Transcript_59381/g.171562  ORF Transcript_59381/g.171562 Transcript_59381/m.171562 type:complete len:179 (-) Transcript_59381:267-803(-)
MKCLLAVSLAIFFVSQCDKALSFTPSLGQCHYHVLRERSILRAEQPATSSDMHPAVVGWPEKYGRQIMGGTFHPGPQVLHEEFAVERGTPETLEKLDTFNWPTWTTGDKEKWAVGNQVQDKEMPYSELSYVIQGRLEIIPKATGVPVVVEPGDFVTFPKGFVASWRVLEELTWHYYLY